MRKFASKFTKITTLLLVVLMMSAVFLIHSFAADSDLADNAYIKAAYDALWDEADKYEDWDTATDDPVGSKVRAQIEPYYTTLSSLSTAGTATVADVDLLKAKGTLAGEIAWIYYSNLPDIANESTDSKAYATHGEIQEAISNEANATQLQIDSQKTYALNGYYARMYVDVFHLKLDTLLASGTQSDDIKQEIESGKQNIVYRGNGTVSDDYQTIYDNTEAAVILQRYRDAAKAELTDVYKKLYPNQDVTENATLKTACANIQKKNTVKDINGSMVTDVKNALASLKTGNKATSYVNSLEDKIVSKQTEAGNSSIADISSLFDNFDPDYYKEVAKDNISALFTPNKNDTDGTIANGLIAEYNNTYGIIDKCADTDDIAFETERAKKRKELYDAYFAAVDKINSYGTGDKYTELAGLAKDKYEDADKLMALVDRDSETAVADYAKKFDSGVAGMTEQVNKAEAQAYKDAHQAALGDDLTTNDIDDILAAIEASDELSDEAKSILNNDRVFDTLANNYKDIINGEIASMIGDGDIRKENALILKDAISSLELSGDPSKATEDLQNLVNDADRALEKAEEIDRIIDRYEQIANEDIKSDLTQDAKDAIEDIQNADNSSNITDIADAAILDISKKEAIARIDAANRDEYTDDVEDTVDDAKAAINDYQSVNDVDAIKAKADETILAMEKVFSTNDMTADADKLKSAIADLVDDGNMTEEQKTALTGKIDEALETAKESVNSATDSQGITDAKATLGSTLNSVKTEAEQKSQAVKDIKEEMDAAQSAVNGLNYIGNTDKASYSDDINDVLNQLQADLLLATTEDEITAAENKASDALDKIVTDSTTADGNAEKSQRAEANNAINTAYSNAIDALEDLSFIKDKVPFTTAIENAYNTAKKTLGEATTADQVKQAKENGVAALNKVADDNSDANDDEQESLSLNTKNNIAQKSQYLINKIKALPYLSDEQKARLTKKVNDTVNTANTEIENAADYEAIEQAESAAETTFNDISQSSDTLNDQEKTSQHNKAKSDLNAKAEEIKNQIGTLTYLSPDEKDNLKDDVDKALEPALGNVDNAGSTNEVSTASSNGIAALDGIKSDANTQNQIAKEEQHSAAKDALEAKAGEIKNHIDGLTYLASDEKDDLKDDVDAALETALGNVDNAGSTDGVSTASSNGITALDGIKSDADTQNQTAKEKQHSAAKDSLEAKAVEIKNHIDGLTYITDDEKSEFKADVDEALAEAISDVDKAISTSDVEEAKSEGMSELSKTQQNADKQNDTAKSTQSTLADGELDSKNNEISSRIDSLEYLSDSEKAALKNELADALADAKDAVRNATSTEDIDAAKADGLADIGKIADNADSKNLENAKASAIKELEAKGSEIDSTVDGFKYLDEDAKAALRDELKDKLADATERINGSESVKDVANIKASAIAELDEHSQKALDDEDAALVDKLTPVIITLGALFIVEAIALAVLLIKRPKVSEMAAFAPIGIGALKLAPVGAWSLTGILAVADVIMAVLIVWLIVERVRVAKAASAAAPEPIPEPEPEPIPEPEPEPEPEPVQIETVEVITVEEADILMTDEEALECEKTDFKDTEIYTGKKKAEINIDTISRNFEAGYTVTLNSLKEKGLVSKQAGYVKVLARGTLDKPLTIIAQSFSVSAIKMIVLTGGTTIRTHGSSERQ